MASGFSSLEPMEPVDYCVVMIRATDKLRLVNAHPEVRQRDRQKEKRTRERERK